MRRRPLFLIMLLVLALATAVAQAQSEIVTITTIDTSHFPTVDVGFQLNTVVAKPQESATYLLTEDGQPVDIQSIIETNSPEPLSLLIVIDQGRYSLSRYRQDYDVAALKQLFYTLGNDFLQADDTVAILTGRWDAGTNGRFQIISHLDRTSDRTAYTQAIDTLDLDLSDIDLNSAQAIETADLLEPAIEQMADQPNAVILYLSALIHAPRESGDIRALNAAERLSAAATAANIQLVVFQTAANTLDSTIQEPMERLATSPNHYLTLRHDRDNSSDATAVYQTLWPQTTSYTATYRSSSATAEPRKITLALADQPDQLAQQTYSVALQPPTVTDALIIQDTNGRYQLTATLTWADALPREVTAVSIGGQNATNFTHSDPTLTALFAIEPQAIVEIAVTDELGLVSRQQVDLPAASQPAVTAVATVPADTPVEPAKATILPAVGRWLPWLGLLLTLGFIAASQRHRLPQLGQQVQQSARRFTTIITGNTRQPVIAHLDILAARAELLNETVNILTDITTLGRNPQLSDIQLYAEDERSSISGQHCTIQFDQGQFHITDNGSANGTRINGHLILADDPHPLQDGDEIQLGHKARRGATLRFTIADAIKRQQRATIADALFPSAANAGTPTQIELHPNATEQPAERLPVIDDDDTWWKKLE